MHTCLSCNSALIRVSVSGSRLARSKLRIVVESILAELRTAGLEREARLEGRERWDKGKVGCLEIKENEGQKERKKKKKKNYR
jgi:hypothetical protein